MENNGLENKSSTKKRGQYIIITCVVLFLALPIVFLFRKPSPSPKNKSPEAAADIAALERAVEETPGYSNLVNLSVAYINANRPGKSIRYLKQALKIKPESAVVYNNLGVAYTMLKNFPRGIEACNRAVILDSSLKLAKNNLKWAFEEQGKTLADISRMEKTPEAKRDPSFYIKLGLNYYYIGNYDKSIIICREGLMKSPDNIVLINNIGTTLVMKRRYDEAIAEFKKVQELEPTNKLAKNNIEWAKSEQEEDTTLFVKK